MSTDHFLTVKEAAERLEVSQASIYIAIKDGRLASQKMYGRVVVAEKDVDEYHKKVGVRNGYFHRAKRSPDPDA